MKSYLILENGDVFEGEHVGFLKETICEIVFSTGMTGYTELYTNPSYRGLGVVMTYPLIGNYGICYEDFESASPKVSAVIMHELTKHPSNFRSEETLGEFLEKHNIPGIEGVDTRALTTLLRDKGSMLGMITTDSTFELKKVVETLKNYKPSDVVKEVSCTEKYTVGDGALSVALLDLGVKKSTLNALLSLGCSVTVYPFNTSASEILKANHKAIVLPNGPGNPNNYKAVASEIKALSDEGVPIFAFGLGHQLLALSMGVGVLKLTCGHRGSNQPVKNIGNGKLYITSQSHSFAVDEKSVDNVNVKVSYINVNDKTVEGISIEGKNIVSLQFYPEGDTAFILEDFINSLK